MPPSPGPAQQGNQAIDPLKIALHQVAAILTAGHIASIQIGQVAYDPTFQSAGSQGFFAYVIGVYKTYYAWLEAAVTSTDGSWAWPRPPAPPTPATGSTSTTVNVAPTVPAPNMAAVQAMLAQLLAGAGS